ncbi:tripartite tricarboxylate transporter substrate binding protein [Bradyrhizobium liaoningense]|uniref:Bug family tripartite tricarboxylate transporter substrate binding protein n=1 Tax=Bradyrhizobium liaoningense TaxID=43992 RepID=UPI001BAAD7A1|nr:tripartite tricarboxylate transporter substrate binding protein [Bradyrhizobium liaoningense]MBR0843255.1 tripartite tricarboxylate transporter substrate binding protein [Bradyrhizobium liaoningense]
MRAARAIVARHGDRSAHIALMATSVFLLGLIVLSLFPGTAAATAAYPNRPITLIVAFEAGGSSDISARLLAQELTKLLGQQVLVENRPGAGGRPGTRRAADAAPDGYTLLWGSGSALTVSPLLYADQQYVRNFTPISLGVTQPFIFVSSTTIGAKTAQDVVALARQQPGKLNFASAGVGSSNHLLGEIFMASTSTEFEHVPYKGGASARDAVVRNEAQLMDEVLSPLIGSIRAGQLQPLFITSESRHPLFPDVPTAAEAGLPDLAIVGFFALLGPARLPSEIVQTLNEAMKQALGSASLRAALDANGFNAAYSTPADLQRLIEKGREQYGEIIARRNIKIE